MVFLRIGANGFPTFGANAHDDNRDDDDDDDDEVNAYDDHDDEWVSSLFLFLELWGTRRGNPVVQVLLQWNLGVYCSPERACQFHGHYRSGWNVCVAGIGFFTFSDVTPIFPAHSCHPSPVHPCGTLPLRWVCVALNSATFQDLAFEQSRPAGVFAMTFVCDGVSSPQSDSVVVDTSGEMGFCLFLFDSGSSN